MRPKYFRGKKIYDKDYPAVCWPEHPLSWESNGVVYIHRVIAYEKYGDVPDDMYVHHIDEDKWNWDPDNLILMTPAAHSALHRSPPDEKVCSYCGQTFFVRASRRRQREKIYCSSSCTNRARYDISWPSVDEVRSMVKELGYSETGRRIGCSDNAVRKFLKRNK